MASQSAETMTVESTLYGGTGGVFWDDGIIFDGVQEIIVRAGKCINSITVVYDKAGKSIRAQKHGENSSSAETSIKLDHYGGEVLTKVIGHYGKATWLKGEPVVIRSLKFVTSASEYGSYGTNDGTPFDFTLKAGQKIIGFFGKSSATTLDAIGFHVTDESAPASVPASAPAGA